MTLDVKVWSVLCGPNRVVYASRPTREEAETVLEEQRSLAERFGLPVRIEQTVIPLRRAGDSVQSP